MTPVPIATLVRFNAYANALSPMLVTELRIVTLAIGEPPSQLIMAGPTEGLAKLIALSLLQA